MSEPSKLTRWWETILECYISDENMTVDDIVAASLVLCRRLDALVERLEFDVEHMGSGIAGPPGWVVGRDYVTKLKEILQETPE